MSTRQVRLHPDADDAGDDPVGHRAHPRSAGGQITTDMMNRVVAGSYQASCRRSAACQRLLSPTAPEKTDSPAKAAGVVALFTAIPAGMNKAAGLIFMVMFVGGMFGVLRATGAIEAGIERLLHVTSRERLPADQRG